MTNTQQCPCDCGGMCVLNADLDAAEAKVEQLKQALHDARLKNGVQAALLEQKRPEPSRLEIAAMVMQGFLSSNGFQIDVPKLSLTYADALIAAAKEGK